MKKISKKIIFFGSGPVASKSLELLANWCEVEAVITKPKPSHHKGSFPVIDTAIKLNLKIHEVQNVDELLQLFDKEDFASKVGLVIDYGIIIPKIIIDSFPLGIVNSHFSLLPELRGADPISYAILQGKTKTGVSLMLINEKMDEGMLLAQKSIDIGAEMTTPELTEELIDLSNRLLRETLGGYIDGEIKHYPQDENIAPTYSAKLTKDQGIVDWSQTAQDVDRQIRAFIQWPKSHTKLADKDVIITKAHLIEKQGKTGEVLIENQNIIVYCGENALVIDCLKPSGKKEMTSKEFVTGYKI